MKPPRRLVTASAGLWLAAAGPALAQDADAARIRELERKLEKSLQLIDQLSEKVRRLEESRPAPPAAADTARLDALQKQIGEVGASLSRRSADEGVPVHGFADVGLGRSTEDNPVFGKGNKGFTVGNFDLYLTPQFGDRVKTLVELVFEVDRNGGLESDLERAQVGYTFSDAATAWLGRFHTPYGFWNTGFHHGAQIQTAVTRPRFLDFEDKGGILPAHTTGVWLTGGVRSGLGKVGYDLYTGNAPRIAVEGDTGSLDMKMAGGASHSPASGFNVWLSPAAVDGLQLGVHGLRATVADDSADANRTRLAMTGAWATFMDDRWELLGEYYRFRNSDVSGGTGRHTSSAGYFQAGYVLGRWTPYVRAERTHLDQQDNYFAVQESGRSYRRQVVGVRYDVDPKAALKFELNRTRQEDLGPGGDDRYGEALMQYAIRF